MKKNHWLKILIIIIFSIICIYLLNLVINPINKVIDRPIDNNIVSAKQIEEYLASISSEIDKFAKNDLTIGYIEMKLDNTYKGKVAVTLSQADSKRPTVIQVHFDTNSSVLEKIQYIGKSSKLYPGVIHIENWVIDSTDAIIIAKNFFSSNEFTEKFRFDEILLNTYNDTLVDFTGNTEKLCIYITDNVNGIRYEAKLDPYSGNIISYSINKSILFF